MTTFRRSATRKRFYKVRMEVPTGLLAVIVQTIGVVYAAGRMMERQKQLTERVTELESERAARTSEELVKFKTDMEDERKSHYELAQAYISIARWGDPRIKPQVEASHEERVEK
jgi:hypothetical protein